MSLLSSNTAPRRRDGSAAVLLQALLQPQELGGTKQLPQETSLRVGHQPAGKVA